MAAIPSLAPSPPIGNILGASGQRCLGANSHSLFAALAGDSCIPPGGSIGTGSIILYASGKPVFESSVKPSRYSLRLVTTMDLLSLDLVVLCSMRPMICCSASTLDSTMVRSRLSVHAPRGVRPCHRPLGSTERAFTAVDPARLSVRSRLSIRALQALERCRGSIRPRATSRLLTLARQARAHRHRLMRPMVRSRLSIRAPSAGPCEHNGRNACNRRTEWWTAV